MRRLLARVRITGTFHVIPRPGSLCRILDSIASKRFERRLDLPAANLISLARDCAANGWVLRQLVSSAGLW